VTHNSAVLTGITRTVCHNYYQNQFPCDVVKKRGVLILYGGRPYRPQVL
jgi:hypothetical protein